MGAGGSSTTPDGGLTDAGLSAPDGRRELSFEVEVLLTTTSAFSTSALDIVISVLFFLEDNSAQPIYPSSRSRDSAVHGRANAKCWRVSQRLR